MSDSDSEDSFHSAENVEEDIKQRDQDVLQEESELEKSTSLTPKSTTLHNLRDRTVEDLSWSDKIETDVDLDRLLLAEEETRPKAMSASLPIKPSTAKQDSKIPSPALHPPEFTSQISWPVNVEQDEPVEMDDSFIRQSSLSLPDTPSENSTDKESGSEMKEWDRLSGNSGGEDSSSSEKNSVKPKQPEEKAKQSVLDDWERGWDDADLTEEDIVAAAVSQPVPPPRVAPSTVAVPSRKKLPESPVAADKKPIEATSAVGNTQAGQGLWGKWGGWGTNLLTSAVGQVGQGLNVVMETVEQSLGAPKPEDLAAMNKNPEEGFKKVEGEQVTERKADSGKPSTEPSEAATGWLSGLTTKVQSGGLSLVTNSLDVLEGLGKRTMEAVNEKDPGFRQTKAVLTGKINQPILSQVLREAKSTRFDAGDKEKASKKREDQVSFVQCFDEEQGTGSWEALELLSSQCLQRIETPEMMAAAASKEDAVEKLEELCQALDYEDSPRDQDIAQTIRSEYGRLNLGLPEPHSLLHIFRVADEFLRDNAKTPATDLELWRRNVHRSGVRTFAASTAKSLEQIRKTAEMIFLNGTNGKQDAKLLLRRVDSVHAIVCSICLQIDKLSNRYAACLALAHTDETSPPMEASKKSSSASSQITDLFVEASNSNRYIQDGLGLCLPIFKLALLS